jgi:NAD(P)-dependent dehydrogenase (short-subunit alcohol dehydrogenase family)
MQDSEFSRDQNSPYEGVDQRAQSLGQEAKAAVSQAADTVKNTVQDEAAKIGDTAREFASETGRKLQDKLQEQRASGADYLLNVAGLVHQAADVFDTQAPSASQYIHQAAEQIGTVAEAVRTKDVRDLAYEVQDFARRQPTIFFGGALLIGFAAVRVFRASPSSRQDNGPAG